MGRTVATHQQAAEALRQVVRDEVGRKEVARGGGHGLRQGALEQRALALQQQQGGRA